MAPCGESFLYRDLMQDKSSRSQTAFSHSFRLWLHILLYHGEDGLHLKSCNSLPGNGNFVSVGALSKISEAGKYIILDHDENYSANCLM